MGTSLKPLDPRTKGKNTSNKYAFFSYGYCSSLLILLYITTLVSDIMAYAVCGCCTIMNLLDVFKESALEDDNLVTRCKHPRRHCKSSCSCCGASIMSKSLNKEYVRITSWNTFHVTFRHVMPSPHFCRNLNGGEHRNSAASSAYIFSFALTTSLSARTLSRGRHFCPRILPKLKYYKTRCDRGPLTIRFQGQV